MSRAAPGWSLLAGWLTDLGGWILAVVVQLAAVGVASLVKAPGGVVARVHLLLVVLAVLVIVASVA